LAEIGALGTISHGGKAEKGEGALGNSDMFVLADDAILLLERFALFDSGPHQQTGGGKSSENCSKVWNTFSFI
jgi:hypothetical protein